jgi:drug/metabolite transporter (DMT)-like permease
MASQIAHEQPQFQADGRPSSLDRCNWCGEPRSAHGPDWSCPAEKRGRGPEISVILGSLLAVGGAIIWAISATGLRQLGDLGAACLFTGITLVVAAAAPAAVPSLSRTLRP